MKIQAVVRAVFPDRQKLLRKTFWIDRPAWREILGRGILGHKAPEFRIFEQNINGNIALRIVDIEGILHCHVIGMSLGCAHQLGVEYQWLCRAVRDVRAQPRQAPEGGLSLDPAVRSGAAEPSGPVSRHNRSTKTRKIAPNTLSFRPAIPFHDNQMPPPELTNEREITRPRLRINSLAEVHSCQACARAPAP